mgnify:CR=1 FL=1
MLGLIHGHCDACFVVHVVIVLLHVHVLVTVVVGCVECSRKKLYNLFVGNLDLLVDGDCSGQGKRGGEDSSELHG